MTDYFFSGNKYIRVTRGDTGPGSIDAGYPAPISNWNWGAFGANGIDAALYSGSKCYFFSGKQYIRVTRGVTGPGSVDPGYPAPISNWNWGAFGANGIDAALWSGEVCYFFSGKEYIRVTRGDTGPGVLDAGYPKPISNWGWGAFGANGIDAALYSGSKCYFFAGNEYIRVSRSDQGPGIIDPGYPAPIKNWNWGSFGANGIKGALYSGGPLVAAPSAGLASNSNYFLDNGGNSLLGVSVNIAIDVDFVSTANGWSIQLNGYSASGDVTGWQQYVVYASPNSGQLVARIDNWNSSLTELIRTDTNLAKLSSATLPAGYAIAITLSNDSNGNITGATFGVSDNKGRSLGSVTTNIVGQTLRTTNKPATSANLAPIRAFQLNIVGDYGSAKATLSGGAGTITYSAASALTAVNAAPSYIDDTNVTTAETANLGYGPLPASANTAVTQSFQAATGAAAAAMEEKERMLVRAGAKRHALPPPE